MRRRRIRPVTVSRDTQEATGRPGFWLLMRICTWQGITPVEQPTIRLALALARQGYLSRAQHALERDGLWIEWADTP